MKSRLYRKGIKNLKTTICSLCGIRKKNTTKNFEPNSFGYLKGQCRVCRRVYHMKIYFDPARYEHKKAVKRLYYYKVWRPKHHPNACL